MSLASATRDANNGTWYVLQYATDFRPRSGAGIRPWMSPVMDGSLFHDDSRHVLELLPKKPAVEVEPWPGLAVDVDGRVYRADAETGRVLVQCGGHTRELVCESGALGAAAGLALDRRGLLYIADPPAHRVLVVNPDDGSLAGVLAGGLDEPVDVVAAPDGRVFVADRRGGRIVSFNSRFDRVDAFAPTDADGVIVTPRPIAVMVDDDGAVLVADGNFPRLLRFTPAGTRLGDAEPEAVLQAIDPPRPVLDALERAYGKRMPRFLAGSCGPCRPGRDGGERLAEVHRALRLIRLTLGHAYPACGTFVSAALDGGAPGTVWHRIVIDADVPEGTWIKVQTVSADNPERLNFPAALPSVAEHDNLLELAGPTFVPFEDASCSSEPRMPDSVPDRLVFSPPGRYLRVRVTLGSDGEATPSIRAIRVFYPRASYLDLLPRVYRRDPESAFFLEHFLALFEHVFTGVEDRYERFTRELNPGAAPLDVLNWLGGLVDLCFDPSWPIERRRALVLAAMELYALRGTPRGLIRYVEIYTGIQPVILEAFLERPVQPPFLGLPGMLLGATTHLSGTTKIQTAERRFLDQWAHRFTMVVFIEDACDEDVTLAVVERIVRANKPAHTVHTLRLVRADARVGTTRVGIDTMLGAREAPSTQIGGCPAPDGPGRPGSVLGTDAILGEQRPVYARRGALTL